MRKFASGRFITQLVFLAACASLCTAGCASSGRLLEANPETWKDTISIGDHLIVLTRSGDEKDFYVTATNESGISGNNAFIPYSDIQSIRVLPRKSGNSGNIAMVIILTVVVIAALVSLVESEIDEGFIQRAQ